MAMVKKGLLIESASSLNQHDKIEKLYDPVNFVL